MGLSGAQDSEPKLVYSLIGTKQRFMFKLVSKRKGPQIVPAWPVGIDPCQLSSPDTTAGEYPRIRENCRCMCDRKHITPKSSNWTSGCMQWGPVQLHVQSMGQRALAT